MQQSLEWNLSIDKTAHLHIDLHLDDRTTRALLIKESKQ